MKTTSRELSIALKEAGAKQESEWSYDKDGKLWNARDKRNRRTHVSSFDCHELLEKAPSDTELHRMEIGFWVRHEGLGYSSDHKYAVEALGEYHLWRLENGHCHE